MATKGVTGREINAALRLHKLSQWDLAVKAGINQASVSAALRGQENFGPDRIAKLTRNCGTGPDGASDNRPK